MASKLPNAAMAAHRLTAVVMAVGLLTACSDRDADPTGPGVVVSEVLLPVGGGEYRGSSAHLFFGGAAELTCGSHGVFSTAVPPPQQVGRTVVSEYGATFVGELTLQPPVVSGPATYSLDVPIRMAESITLASTGDGVRVFDTELVTFELLDGMPDAVVVRESPSLASVGITTITSLSDGLDRVESHYDVWLEISLDGGRSWEPAEAAVRMTLAAG